MEDNGLSEQEKKIKYGIQLIQEGYNEKISEHIEESNKWKNLLQKTQKQNSELDVELKRAGQRILELEHLLSEQIKETEKAIEMRDVVVDKYNILKKQTIQLRQFKKSILSMVESDDGSPFGEKLAPLEDNQDDNFFPYFNNNKNVHNKAAPVNKSVIVESANNLYQEIKQVTSPSDFQLFGKYINLLNQGALTTEQALNNISKIVKDNDLLKRLRWLMEEAEKVTNE